MTRTRDTQVPDSSSAVRARVGSASSGTPHRSSSVTISVRVRGIRHSSVGVGGHADFKQQADTEGRETGRPYSTNPDHYVPMCRSCHSRFDNVHRRLVGDSLSPVGVAYWIMIHEAEKVAA